MRSAHFRILIVALTVFVGSQWLHADVDGPRPYLKNDDKWFATDKAKEIAQNILSWQSDLGGWLKNYDTAAVPYEGNRQELNTGHVLHPTFDNDATMDEMRYLARIYNVTHDDVYKTAVERGLEYMLKAQYPNGGWPQSYPPDHQYHRYITFNDNAMVRIMDMLREIDHTDRYPFISAEKKQQVQAAFDHGVECILNCQIRVNGKLTAWCAQHDEKDLSPKMGRSFELASISGAESVGITRLLMGLEHPSPRVIESIESAVAWFKSAELTGIKVVEVQVPGIDGSATMRDRKVVEDPSAPPLWARFYDISTNKPLFSNRDSIPKWHYADMGQDRRMAYNWYGSWPQVLLTKDYPAWKTKLEKATTVPTSAALESN